MSKIYVEFLRGMVFSTGALIDLPVKADTGTMHSSGLTSWQYREISVGVVAV